MPKRPPKFEPTGSRQQRASHYDQARGHDRQFYGSRPWRRLRAKVLRERPLCEHHKRQHQLVRATEVHHVIDRRERPELAMDEENLETLCKPCHSRETATRQAKRGR